MTGELPNEGKLDSVESEPIATNKSPKLKCVKMADCETIAASPKRGNKVPESGNCKTIATSPKKGNKIPETEDCEKIAMLSKRGNNVPESANEKIPDVTETAKVPEKGNKVLVSGMIVEVLETIVNKVSETGNCGKFASRLIKEIKVPEKGNKVLKAVNFKKPNISETIETPVKGNKVPMPEKTIKVIEPKVKKVPEMENTYEKESTNLTSMPESVKKQDKEPVNPKIKHGKLLRLTGKITLNEGVQRCKLYQFKEILVDEVDQSDFSAAVYVKEKTEITTDELTKNLAALPELQPVAEPIQDSDLDVGELENTKRELKQMKDILWKYKHVLHKGGSMPPAAKGVYCDIDVKGHKPVAQRARAVPKHLIPKLYDLLKNLLECKLIQFSVSPWASPIVIVIKKNGVDIRLCIDYRLVNSFTDLMIYPMPLINDLLLNFEMCMWFFSLDAVNGFWVVPMTLRAQIISAFVCPLGHFEWMRMPQGLKNAPQIYQRMMDNALWGFVQPIVNSVTEQDAFALQQVDKTAKYPDVRSFIDDIGIGSKSWSGLCDKLEWFLERMSKSNIGISLPKSQWGKRSITLLAHVISGDGIRTKTALVDKVLALPFPTSLRGMQSFLGSLNFYNKFIDNFATKAACLYEMKDEDFVEPPGMTMTAYGELRKTLTQAPILRVPVQDKDYIIILYSCKWAVGAALCQNYDGVMHPVQYVSRVLKDSELNYHEAEKEVLALLRALSSCYNIVAGRSLTVYTRYTVLKWLYKSKSLMNGRALQWAVMLSPWQITFEKLSPDSTTIAELAVTSVLTPIEYKELMDKFPPKKLAKAKPKQALEWWDLTPTMEAIALSFDGSAKLKSSQSAYSFILWKLPEWEIIKAGGAYRTDGTVNEAEYRGVLEGMKAAIEEGIEELYVWGDSRIIIEQITGAIACRSENLQQLLDEVETLKPRFKKLKLAHYKREYNQSADHLATIAMKSKDTIEPSAQIIQFLKNLNTMPALLQQMNEKDLNKINTLKLKKQLEKTVESREMVVYEGGTKTPDERIRNESVREGATPDEREVHPNTEPLTELEVVAERKRRIAKAQDNQTDLHKLKLYMTGELDNLSMGDCGWCEKQAGTLVIDFDDILCYVDRSPLRKEEDRPFTLRYVVPNSMKAELLQMAHDAVPGCHQGIQKTFFKLRGLFYWKGIFKEVERYVKGCPDCATGSGLPRNIGRSKGNIIATRPGQIWAMDFKIPIRKSKRGNVALLVFVCLYTGYKRCLAMPFHQAIHVAQAIMHCIYEFSGACQVLRHDRDPRFMAEVMTEFREMMKIKSSPTLAYRPQSNGSAENAIRQVMGAVKMYLEETDQSDWDDVGQAICQSQNSSFDFVRKDTSQFLFMGFDAETPLTAMIPREDPDGKWTDAKLWRNKIWRQHQIGKQIALDLIIEAKEARKDKHNENLRETAIDKIIHEGDRVWVYVPHVRKGYTKKLAHLWHGPYRVLEIIDDIKLKLLTPKEARFHPEIHIGRVKKCMEEWERPTGTVDIDLNEALFDEALLPEDSWEPDAEANEYEVEEILEKRVIRKTRRKRSTPEYLVKWKGHRQPTWEPETHLKCGGLLYKFWRKEKADKRQQALVMSDEEIEG